MPLYLGPSRSFTDFYPTYDSDRMLINTIRSGNKNPNGNSSNNSNGNLTFSSFNYSKFLDKHADDIIKYNLKRSIRKSQQPSNYPPIKYYQPCSM